MLLKELAFGLGDSQTEKEGLETAAPCSHPIAGVFVPIFEGKLCYP
jgi:hypothetical protein